MSWDCLDKMFSQMDSITMGMELSAYPQLSREGILVRRLHSVKVARILTRSEPCPWLPAHLHPTILAVSSLVLWTSPPKPKSPKQIQDQSKGLFGTGCEGPTLFRSFSQSVCADNDIASGVSTCTDGARFSIAARRCQMWAINRNDESAFAIARTTHSVVDTMQFHKW